MKHYLFKTLLRAPEGDPAAPPPQSPPQSPPAPSPTPTPSPATPPQNPTPTPAPAPETPKAFWNDLPEDLRTSHTVTKHKDIESLARHAVSLEKRLGVPPERLLTLPEDRSNPEAMAEVYRALGRPDAPEGYAVQVVEGAPDYISAYAGDLAKELHGLGASKAIVDKVVELTNKTYQAQLDAQNKATADDQARIDGEIKAQWGDQTDAMRQAVTNLFKDEIDATPNLTDAQKAERWTALKDELAGQLGKSPILFGLMARQVQARLEGNPLPVGDLLQGLNGAMSHDQAVASKNAFQADKTKMEAWRNASHPNHKAAVKELEGYNKIIVGAKRKK